MLLKDYLEKIGLPNPIIEFLGDVSKCFLKNGILTLWDAVEYIYKLPYGRTTNREDYLQILDEKKGVCSGKHALISALAEELFIPFNLSVIIYTELSKFGVNASSFIAILTIIITSLTCGGLLHLCVEAPFLKLRDKIGKNNLSSSVGDKQEKIPATDTIS